MTTTKNPFNQHLSEHYHYSIRTMGTAEVCMYEHLIEQYIVASTAEVEEDVRLAMMFVGEQNLWTFANLFGMKQRHFSEYMDGVKTDKKKLFSHKKVDGSWKNIESDFHVDTNGEKVEDWEEGDTPRFYYRDYPIHPTYYTITPSGTFVLNDTTISRMRKGTRTAYLKKEKMLDTIPSSEETQPVEVKDIKCCLCPGVCRGAGNDPTPLSLVPDAKCCDTCNVMSVLPARYTKSMSPCNGSCDACHSSIHTPKSLDMNACSVTIERNAKTEIVTCKDKKPKRKTKV
jgi:hypothetical protein